MKTLINFISSLMKEWAFVLVVSCIALYNARLFGMNAFHIIPIPFVLYYFINFSKHQSFQKDYIILFILLMIQTFFFTIASEGGDVFGNMKVYILSLLVMTYKPNLKVADNLLTILAISGLVLGFYTLQHPEYIGDFRLTVRIGDVVQDPTWITVLLLPSFCVGLCWLGMDSILQKMLGMLVMLFCVYIVFLSGSRGTLLAMLVAVVTWITYSRSKTNRLKIIFSLFFLILIGYFAFMAILGVLDEELLSRYTEDDTSGHIRLYTWSLIINGIFEGNILQLFFGHGLGSCIRDFRLDAHNMLLQQIYEMGVFGLIVMLTFLYKITQRVYASKNTCCKCLINALIFVALLTPIWGHIYYFTLLSSILYIVNSEKKNNKINYLSDHEYSNYVYLYR